MTHHWKNARATALLLLMIIAAFAALHVASYYVLKPTGFMIFCERFVSVYNDTLSAEYGASKRIDMRLYCNETVEPSPTPTVPPWIAPGAGGGGGIIQPCKEDADCGKETYCVNNKCIYRKKLGEMCGRDAECLSNICEDGACVQCLTNAQCPTNMFCVNHFCETVECACGYVKDNTCVKYECCSNKDCPQGYCDVREHICVKTARNKLVITISPEIPVEGRDTTFIVTDGEGKAVEDAIVNLNGKIFATDKNGVVIAKVDGGLNTVTAEKDGYLPDRLAFTALMILKVTLPKKVVPGEYTEIIAVDAKNNRVPTALIEITWSDGTTETLRANEEGVASLFVKYFGDFVIKAEKPGYLPFVTTASALQIQEGLWDKFFKPCGMPAWLNLIIFVLLIIAINLATRQLGRELLKRETGTKGAFSWIMRWAESEKRLQKEINVLRVFLSLLPLIVAFVVDACIGIIVGIIIIAMELLAIAGIRAYRKFKKKY
jgi:hypothetical protein